MQEKLQFHRGDALLIVDVQRDFCHGGALAVDDGDAVVPPLNACMAAARDAGIPIVTSRDWHPMAHVSFAERGGPWPAHCVQDTPGAAFHPDLAIGDDCIRVSKGSRFDRDAYSAFDNTGLTDYLKQCGVQRLWIGGLALDVCVLHTALDAVTAGFDTHLLRNATRAVDRAQGEAAVARLRDAGVHIEDGNSP